MRKNPLTTGPLQVYTLKEVLPRTIGPDSWLTRVIGKGAEVTPEQIRQMAQDIGDAVLLLLCNGVFSRDSYFLTDESGNVNASDDVKNLYHKMLWDTVMRALGVPFSEKKKRITVKELEKKISEMERQGYAISVTRFTRKNGKLCVEKSLKKKLYEGEKGVKTIHTDRIHRDKDAGLKKPTVKKK